MENAKSVVKASMKSTWIHHIRHCELPDPTKTLKHSSFHDLRFVA